MNIQNIQRADMAGKTKLTAITLGHGNHRVQTFANIQHDKDGHAILPNGLLNKMLTDVNSERGDTFTVG